MMNVANLRNEILKDGLKRLYVPLKLIENYFTKRKVFPWS